MDRYLYTDEYSFRTDKAIAFHMSDSTLFYISSIMSNDQKRIRDIKCHINQLLSELRLIKPNDSYLEHISPFNITMNSSLATIPNEKSFLDHHCPFLFHKKNQFHSTTYHENKKIFACQNKKKKKITQKNYAFTSSTYATSTPKKDRKENIFLQPHLTSTPRRNQYQQTNMIPLKRLLYTKDSRKQRNSTKRTIRSRQMHLNPIDESPQWI